MIDVQAIACYYHAHVETLPAWGGGEMVDAGDLKSPGATHEGSIPSRPTSSFKASSEAILLPSKREHYSNDVYSSNSERFISKGVLLFKMHIPTDYKKGFECYISINMLISLRGGSRL
jgi:hypothetical protein